jgi:hypothetical protein
VQLRCHSANTRKTRRDCDSAGAVASDLSRPASHVRRRVLSQPLPEQIPERFTASGKPARRQTATVVVVDSLHFESQRSCDRRNCFRSRPALARRELRSDDTEEPQVSLSPIDGSRTVTTIDLGMRRWRESQTPSVVRVRRATPGRPRRRSRGYFADARHKATRLRYAKFRGRLRPRFAGKVCQQRKRIRL